MPRHVALRDLQRRKCREELITEPWNESVLYMGRRFAGSSAEKGRGIPWS